MATYSLIATTTLSSATTTIGFSGISSAYTDLEIVGTLVPSTVMDAYFRFNSNTGNNYYSQYMGNSSGSRGLSTYLPCPANGASISTATFVRVIVQNYKQTTNYQAGQTLTGGSGNVCASFFRWQSTAAINDITFTANQNFAVGTSLSLYGILGA